MYKWVLFTGEKAIYYKPYRSLPSSLSSKGSDMAMGRIRHKINVKFILTVLVDDGVFDLK